MSKALARLLFEHSMTQERLAELSGISQSQVSKYCVGKTERISIKSAQKFAKVFDCEISDLYDPPTEARHEQPSQTKEEAPIAFELFTTTNRDAWIPLFTEQDKANIGLGTAIRRTGASQTVKRPSFLEHCKTAYAITNIGDNMMPRYRSKDILFVDPSLRPEAGDDIILLFGDEAKLIGLVKECKKVSSDGMIEATEIMYGTSISYDADKLFEVHVVVGMQRVRG